MAEGTEDQGREELLAENRARRAQLRAEEEAKAARKAGDDATADTAEDGDGDESVTSSRDADGPHSGGAPTKLVVALGAAVAILIVAVGVLGYLLATADSDADSSGPAVAELQVVKDAKNYAATVLTYSSGDYGDLDKRIREISTPAFADRYITSSQEARKGNDEAQAKGVAEAKEAGLISLSDDTAEVLVAVDQKVTSPLVPAAGDDGLEYQSRVKITLTRDGDAWKLSDLSVV